MADAPERVLLVFLDGVGLGPDDPETNPLARARLPALASLLGGERLVAGARVPADARARLVPADATLGVEGRPQSGTGQTALFTGANAPAILGRHFGPWVHTSLRPLLAETNLLRLAVDAGRTVAFANAYPAGYLEGIRGRRPPRPAAPPLVARSAGALTRDASALREGLAVASSITNEGWRKHLDTGMPDVSAEQAGRNLARISATAQLTLFAHYDTDTAGHRGEMSGAVAAIERVDAFLGGLAATLGDDTLLVASSDHGNLEEVSGGHTLNPVPVLAMGPGREALVARVRSLTDVTPAILHLLGVP